MSKRELEKLRENMAMKPPPPRPSGAPDPLDIWREWITPTHFVYEQRNHKKIMVPRR